MSLFVAIPVGALVLIITMLVWSDASTLNDLRRFESSTSEVAALVEARGRAQSERHELLNSGSADEVLQRPVSVDLFGAAAFGLLDESAQADVGDELLIARGLAVSGQVDSAIDHYNEVVDAFTAAIRIRLVRSPGGEIDRRSDALLALLTAEEAMLREDLEIQLGIAETNSIVRSHTIETEAFGRFARNTAAQGVSQLESITTTEAWRTIALARTEILDSPRAPLHVGWPVAAAQRRVFIAELVHDETSRLVATTTSLSELGGQRLAALIGVIVAVLVVCVAGAAAIRRSIVQPLGVLTRAANRLSRGELAPVADPASDEIASVAHAFSSLADTMQAIWTDVNNIGDSVRHTEYDRRIATESLQGDWLRLAQTVNSTLATGAEHSRNVDAELVRRDILTEISGEAVLAQSASSLTASVLRHLPAALPGSHAHLHLHPSGPPVFDLGISLEPSISALELPTLTSQAQRVELRDGPGVASLVDFGSGPPAVLILAFGDTEPDDAGPLVGLVETAARVLAQAHRRQAAEWSAAHHFEHDALTGLRNAAGLQRWFRELGPDVDDLMVIGAEPLGLDVLDSSYGRDARNALLTIVARRLRRAVGEHEIIGRLGDPEFVVLARAAAIGPLLDQIIAAFAHPLAVGDELLTVELTIGVAPVAGDLEQSIANAATSIRQSAGRHTEIVHFEQEHRDRVVRRSEVERWLESAVENHDLEVHFQPIVSAVSTVPVGYECLVRGKRNGVPISPGEFIPVAEESNLILEIGEFTLREACAALPFLPGEQPYVSVNLSPLELSDDGLIERTRSILDDARVDRSRIVLEVTEGAATTDEHVEVLHRIRDLGVMIAIDDFGSGHSNLSYLSNLPAQIVKLDRSLVTPIVTDRAALAVVQGTIAMAHEIGMTVVGEGVESNEELNALRRVRCDRIQGWLTGRPAPLSDLIELAHDAHAGAGSTRRSAVAPDARAQ